jgi:hypothetical protein
MELSDIVKVVIVIDTSYEYYTYIGCCPLSHFITMEEDGLPKGIIIYQRVEICKEDLRKFCFP